MRDLLLRGAGPGDEQTIVTLLGEAASCQRMSQEFSLTVAEARKTLTGPGATARCLLAFADGAPAGIALWFWSYRSFRGRRGLFLEDLYVRPGLRRQGLGTQMLGHLAEVARARDAFMEWVVLDWNTSAQEFYARLGGIPKTEFIGFRLDGEQLQKLAS